MAIAESFDYPRNGVGSLNADMAAARAKVACLCLLGVWIMTFYQPLLALLQAGLQQRYDKHTLVAIPVSLLLFTRCLPALKRVPFGSSQLGLVGLLCVSIIWLFCNITELYEAQICCQIAMLPLLLLICFGRQWMRVMRYPVIGLLFLIPFGHWIAPLVEAFATWSLLKLLSFAGLTLYWEGAQITTLKNHFQITHIFSSMQAFSMVCLLSYLLAHYLLLHPVHRICFGLAMLVTPVVANVLGLCMVIQFEHLEALSKLSEAELIALSWGLAGVGGLFACLVGWMLHVQEANTVQAYPDRIWHKNPATLQQRWFQPSLVAICILILFPHVSGDVRSFSIQSIGTLLLQPPSVADWAGPRVLASTGWQHRLPSTAAVATGEYFRGSHGVTLQATHYQNAMPVTGLRDNPTALYDATKWKRVKHRSRTIVLSDDRAWKVIETLLNNGGQHQVIWHWFHVRGIMTSNVTYAKILDRVRLLSNTGEGSGVIAVATRFSTDLSEGQDRLKEFLNCASGSFDTLMHPPRKMN